MRFRFVYCRVTPSRSIHVNVGWIHVLSASFVLKLSLFALSLDLNHYFYGNKNGQIKALVAMEGLAFSMEGYDDANWC